MIILRKFANINIKQFLKFKMLAFKHLIRKKHLFRPINKNVFMRKMIDDLIIKTQTLETMHEKSDYKKKKDLSKNRDKIFLIRNHAKRQKYLKICDLCQRKSVSKKKDILHFI